MKSVDNTVGDNAHPYHKMLEFNRQNPEAKEVYRSMQAWQIKNKPDNGVFCPIFEICAVYSPRLRSELSHITRTNMGDLSYDSYMYANKLHLYGTWRNSLGIYKIDDDVIGDVLKSPIPLDTPVSIFERLPEWCIYLDFNGAQLKDSSRGRTIKLLGFWALFDTALVDGKHNRILRLVLNLEGADDVLGLIEIPIDNGKTIEKSIMDLYLLGNDEDPFLAARHAKSDIDMTRILLSALLWLCAEEPDITNIKGEPISGQQLRLPKYRTNKKTGAFVPPSQPIYYNIGQRLGGDIRVFNERVGASDSRISSRKRPHIRRGHWHGVWTGTGQNKQFKVYWQPAIFVNAS